MTVPYMVKLRPACGIVGSPPHIAPKTEGIGLRWRTWDVSGICGNEAKGAAYVEVGRDPPVKGTKTS